MKIASLMKPFFLSTVLLSSSAQATWFNNEKLVKGVNEEIRYALRVWFGDIFNSDFVYDYNQKFKFKIVDTIKVSGLTAGQDDYIKYRICQYLANKLSEGQVEAPLTIDQWLGEEIGKRPKGHENKIPLEALKGLSKDHFIQSVQDLLRKYLYEISDHDEGRIVLTGIVKKWKKEWKEGYVRRIESQNEEDSRKLREKLEAL